MSPTSNAPATPDTQDETVSTETPLVTIEAAREHITKNDRVKAQLTEHNVVNPIALASALGVRPQMLYNYIRNNQLSASTNSSGKLVIDGDVAVTFAQKYLNRKAVQAAKVQAELEGAKAS